ncbi:MAG: ribosomal-processing cysteine protease Prp, partial [Lachnospiraceae bacterium]|nr:ribosomal-processing cysteine protease Prp [Lachnospiraceae bacterium]
MEVTFYKDSNGTVKGFQISGHSEYGPAGQDIL